MRSARAGHGLAALDHLSERLLLAAGGLRVAVAATAPERDAILALRYRQVVEGGWVRAEELPGGLERDEHDARALQIGAWADDALVGAMRLVFPAPGERLPVEKAFDLNIEPRGAVVEAGRLVVSHQHRGDPAHACWGALFACAWLTMRARGFGVLGGAASPRMVARLRTLGLPFEILGSPRPYWGEPRVPVRLDPAGARPEWFGGVPDSG